MTTTRPRRRRGKTLIALLAATAALTGAQALAASPASAMVRFDMTEEECNSEFGVWSWFNNSCDINFGGSGGSGGPSYGGVGGGGGGSSDGGGAGGGGGASGGGSGSCSEQVLYLEEGGTCPDDFSYPGDDEEENTCPLPDPDPYEGGSCELELPAEDQVPDLKTVIDHLKDAFRDFRITRDEINAAFCAAIKKRERELSKSKLDGVWVQFKRGGSKKELLHDLRNISERRGCDHLL